MDGQLQHALLTPSRIGDVNRSRVLQVLCDHGALSRAELAKTAGVTRATIGNIVQGLIDDGILEEGEPQTGLGRVGKPGTPVWFGARAGLSGAVAVSAEGIEAALVNARGDVLDVTDRPLARGAGAAAVAAAATDALRAVLPRRGELLGIGVAVPGVVDAERGLVVGSGQMPGLDGAALASLIGEGFSHQVLLDNDSRAQALGEKWFGEGKGVRTFVSLQTGHGLGAGIVIDGVVLRGRDGLTGEIGHTCVVPDGEPCRCGLRGCWETIATLGWLRAEAKRRKIKRADALDAASLLTLGDDDLLAQYVDNLAIGLANITQLLNPDALILHGDAARGGEPFRALVEDAVRARSLATLRPSVRVVLSTLDQRAALLGAAGLVLSETFNLAS
ncbi:MAG TPA: ROK family transcriptional regulator [Acidimicrobiales bacterium]|nr:ROK family transcriptional regulator [Acidimicrobiales bacterium]